MKIITAIEEDLPHKRDGYRSSVFLAGGITNCPDWQTQAIELIGQLGGKMDWLTTYNPRRINFPIDDPNAAEEQIRWEFKYLNKAKNIVFWFPKETLCPITLFEYGKWLRSTKQLFVGCHPDYARKADLIIQTELECDAIEIFNNLEDVIRSFTEYEFICRYPPG